MRHRSRARVGRLASGWLAPLVFLSLPACRDILGFEDPLALNLSPGPPPRSGAVFCDIEDHDVPRHCATPEEVQFGIPLTEAALALTRLESSNFGLDHSPEAVAALGCAPGQPVTVTFKSGFPDGSPVCLNCSAVIGPVFPDAGAACVARCKDLHESYQNRPKPEVDQFCADTARTSTNIGECMEGVCTDAGQPKSDFVDPRRATEPVVWGDRSPHVVLSGPDQNTLIKVAGGTGNFDAGAASTQLITRGDGYVEFTASETTTNRILGLAVGGLPDGNHSHTDITFGIQLAVGGLVKISENGVLVPAPDGNPASRFATFVTGDRLRVSVTDNLDGHATVTYSLISAVCPSTACPAIPLRATGPAPYPFRVDATLGQPGSMLADVRLVRIR